MAAEFAALGGQPPQALGRADRDPTRQTSQTLAVLMIPLRQVDIRGCVSPTFGLVIGIHAFLTGGNAAPGSKSSIVSTHSEHSGPTRSANVTACRRSIDLPPTGTKLNRKIEAAAAESLIAWPHDLQILMVYFT